MDLKEQKQDRGFWNPDNDYDENDWTASSFACYSPLCGFSFTKGKKDSVTSV
jgi:hypothetical protein